MKLVGLDFETANKKIGSICAAGCAVLEDGVVRESREWLLCPHQGYRWMQPNFTQIHGLHYWDVRNCPEFPDIWPEMRQLLISADCVVIHNAPFDLGHLRSVLELYELPPLEFDYADSLRISRRLFPEMSSHSLDAVAGRFGISFQHHNALEDARACAQVLFHTGISKSDIRHFSTL